MSNPNFSLTKTCTNCGLQKPLSAFLQISGKEGSTYGNICSTCRKGVLDKPKFSTPEESTTSDSGLKIDSKAKVHADIEKMQQRERVEDLYTEERKKDEKQNLERTQKKEGIVKDEKKHHQSFLDKRSSSENKKTVIEQSLLHEQAEKEPQIDLTVPFIDTQFSGKVKYEQSSVFNQFKSWLGKSSPLVHKGGQVAQKDQKNNQEIITEFMDKKFGPGKKR